MQLKGNEVNELIEQVNQLKKQLFEAKTRTSVVNSQLNELRYQYNLHLHQEKDSNLLANIKTLLTSLPS